MKSCAVNTDVYLPAQSQLALVGLARHTLEAFVRRINCRRERIRDAYLHARDYGAFVSLHNKQELRGCVGNCAPGKPLFKTVIEMTRAAAAADYRMAPVATGELESIDIEITVISPLMPIDDPLALEPGKYGFHVSHGERRGVLLPQVATRFGWDMKTLLEQTCLKADLPKHAWKDAGTEVSCFTALIIEEHP
jgi:AmmeMemoRadiSam system protein A